MNELFDILKALQDSKHRKVLATINDVEGSSYRKEGTMMLYVEDGTKIGLLSGGCLENDLTVRADEVIKEKTSRTIVYDMKSEDDLAFGQGSGCNGTISVLLELVDTKLEKHLKKVENYLKQGISVLHVKRLSEFGTVLDYIFITQDQKAFGEWCGEYPAELTQLFSKCKKSISYLENVPDRYFIQVFKPKPRLIIFGAGPDVRPLVSFANKTGFTIIIADWRPAYCNETYFPDATDIILNPCSFLSNFSFSLNDSVIIMTHSFQKDQEILNTLFQKRVNYLGVLGPRKRTYRLLDGRDIPDWLHSPVGLPIGAEGPEEIAVSILADVIKAVRKRDQHDFWNIPSSRPEQKNGVS
ncbi:XdhC family protein [Halalkalibacter lacteus]|uniref:XdhC family protein n=1 Tax=Halalkalibacter lacteus TaxID=3090663 RepID=UPI002FC76C73